MVMLVFSCHCCVRVRQLIECGNYFRFACWKLCPDKSTAPKRQPVNKKANA